MKRNDSWRIIVTGISIFYILYLWIRKDVLSIYATMPREEVLPLIFTTIFVSLFKIVVLVGILLFIKWILSKIKKK